MIIPQDYSIEQVIRHLEQIGINFRQSGAHQSMKLYIEHLKSELRMTEQFLLEDSGKPRRYGRKANKHTMKGEA